MSEAEETISPYPGLRPFQRHEAHLFFGREAAVALMLERLRVHRFLAITGPSGCGKSSLVRAGLLHELDCGGLGREHESWRMVVFRPGRNALGSMAQALAEALAPELERLPRDTDVAVDQQLVIQTRIQRSQGGLVSWLADLGIDPHQTILLLVDQFEEVFRYEAGSGVSPLEWRNQTDRFIQSLLEACAQTRLPIFVCLTIRLDFLGDCAHFDGLAEAISDGQFLVPKLSRTEVELAIGEPAKVYGGTVEERLITQLANDIAAEHRADLSATSADPDMLPLMQHVLAQLWKSAESASPGTAPRLTLEQYVAAGGVAGALSAHLDALYAALTPAQQGLTEKLFKALCQSSADLRARDVRRPITIGEALRATGADKESLLALLAVFTGEGKNFLTVHGRGTDSDDLIDISHEALIRQWGRLQTWVREEGTDAKEYAALERQALAWQDGRAELLSGRAAVTAAEWWNRRSDAVEWARRYGQAPELTAKFVSESAEQEARIRRDKARARRNTRIFWSAAGLVALVIGLYILIQARSRNDLMLQQSSLVARIAQEKLKAGDPALAAILAREVLSDSAGGTHPRPYSPKAEAVLYASLRKLNTDTLLSSNPVQWISTDPARPLFVTLSKTDPALLALWSRRQKGTEWKIPSGADDVVTLATPPLHAAAKGTAESEDGWVFTAGGSRLYVARVRGVDSAAPTLDPGVTYYLPEGAKHVNAMAFDIASGWLAVAGVKDNKHAVIWLFNTSEFQSAEASHAAADAKSNPRGADDATSTQQTRLTPVATYSSDDCTAQSDKTPVCMALRSLRFLPHSDPTSLLTVGTDGSAALWHISRNGDATSMEFERLLDSVNSVAVSADGRRIFTGSDKGAVTQWERHGTDLVKLPGNNLPGKGSAYVLDPVLANGTVLVAAFLDDASYARLYTWPTQKFWGELVGVNVIPKITREGNEDALLIVNTEGALSLKTQDHGYQEMDFDSYLDNRVVMLSSGFMVVTRHTAGEEHLDMWNLRTAERVRSWQPPEIPAAPYAVLAASGKSAFVAVARTAKFPGSWTCLDLASQQRHPLGSGAGTDPEIGQAIQVARLSDDGARVFVLDTQGLLTAWQCSGERLWSQKIDAHSELLPAGDVLAITDASGRIYSGLVSQQSGANVIENVLRPQQSIAGVSADGSTVVFRSGTPATPYSRLLLNGSHIEQLARALPRTSRQHGTECGLALAPVAPQDLVALSDDGQVFAAALPAGSAAVWQGRTRVAVTPGVFQGIDVAPAGALVTFFGPRDLGILDLNSARKEPRVLKMDNEEADLKAAVAAPDGRSVLALQPRQLTQWSLSGKRLDRLMLPDCEVGTLARVPHTAQVMVGCGTAELIIVELTPALRASQRFSTVVGVAEANAAKGAVGAGAFKFNSYWIKAGDKTINLAAQPAGPMQAAYWNMSISWPGKRFMLWSALGDLFLWDADGSEPVRVQAPQAPLLDVDVREQQLVTLYFGGELKVSSLQPVRQTGSKTISGYSQTMEVTSNVSPLTEHIGYLDSGAHLATMPGLLVIDPAHPQTPAWTLGADEIRREYGWATSADGKLIGIVLDDGSLALIDTQSWHERTFPAAEHYEKISSISGNLFSDDDRMLVRPISERRLSFQYIDKSAKPFELPDVGDIAAYRMSPNGAYIGVTYSDHTFRLWHIASATALVESHFTGSRPGVFFGKNSVGIVTFSGIMRLTFPTLDFVDPEHGEHLLGPRPLDLVQKGLNHRALTAEEREQYLQ